MSCTWFERQTDRLFQGEVASWVYPALRIGIASIFFVRHTDWTRPWVSLEHHRWVKGFEFTWSIAERPYLVSPLIPGLGLSESTTTFLLYARTASALLLLLGFRARASALLLATVSYVLLASDRYRYFHHLHLLYVSVALLSFAPIGARWSLDHSLERLRQPRETRARSEVAMANTSPVWPLQMLRALVGSTYFASGLSKLDPAWLSGDTLMSMHHLHVLGGPAWDLLHAHVDYSRIAKFACLTELALPGLLIAPITRYWAIIGAILFHCMISASMSVSTFGAQMAVLLLSFIPRHYLKGRHVGGRVMHAVEQLNAEQRARVGAYWWRRAEGELTSWVGFQHVLADLRAESSPAAVVALAERAVNDEYQHAVFCREWAERFGHPVGDLRPRSDRPATFVGATEDQNRLLRITLCCFTETVGCFILRHVRSVVNDSALRQLNRRHLADELQHSRVGWGHLATLDETRKAFLRSRIPGLLRLLPSVCCDGPEQDCEELVPFGYFTARLLRAAHDEAVREVIVPGLEHVGLT